VTARYHLGALKRNEIEDYVNFRLGVAGCRKPLFSRQALNQLYRSTKGIPRRINVLADHTLLSTYSKNKIMVDAKIVKEGAKEVFIHTNKGEGHADSSSKFSFNSLWLPLFALFALNLALWWWFIGRSDLPSVVTQPPVFDTQLTADETSNQTNSNSSGQTAIRP